MGRIVPYIMENKKCSKPPTRYYIPSAPSIDHLPTIEVSLYSGKLLVDIPWSIWALLKTSRMEDDGPILEYESSWIYWTILTVRRLDQSLSVISSPWWESCGAKNVQKKTSCASKNRVYNVGKPVLNLLNLAIYDDFGDGLFLVSNGGPRPKHLCWSLMPYNAIQVYILW